MNYLIRVCVEKQPACWEISEDCDGGRVFYVHGWRVIGGEVSSFQEGKGADLRARVAILGATLILDSHDPGGLITGVFSGA